MRPALTALAVCIALGVLGAAQAQPEAPKLAFPLACQIGRTCEIQHYVDRDPTPAGLDYRCGHRIEDKHDGIDFRIPDMAAQRAGVDVLAAAAGRVVAVRDGIQDISDKAPGAPSVVGHECGNRVGIGLPGGWVLDYCHLAQGSLKVKVGDAVAVGQPLAHVGLSGFTEFPHLHFSVRHGTQLVDPFAPASLTGCEAQAVSLWTPAAASQMPYKRGAILNAGFAATTIDNAAIEAGRIAAPAPASAAVVAYVRLIGLEPGDVIDMSLLGPDGTALATGTLPPLDGFKDQFVAQLGHKRPTAGWPPGAYTAVAQVRRGGAVVITRRWQVRL